MTHCFKECLMPLEIDNLSSFICKMSACQVVSKRQTSKDTAARVVTPGYKATSAAWQG